MFDSRKIFSKNAIFGKGKYFQVFCCIMKIVLENIFICLVTFWKCYFPPPHNRKTTKTPPPTPPQQQQKSKSHRKNHREREIGSWVSDKVEGSWVEGSGSKISGSKALGSWRDLSSGFASEVEDWFVGSWREGLRLPAKSKARGSKIDGSKALALGRRLWVRGVIWAMGSPVKSKIGSWVCGTKALGR